MSKINREIPPGDNELLGQLERASKAFLSRRALLAGAGGAAAATMIGFEGSSIGENIAASSGDNYNINVDSGIAAINFVRIMIVDAGVADLGHRMTMLSSRYFTIGIGYSRNPASTFVNYNVQDYGNL